MDKEKELFSLMENRFKDKLRKEHDECKEHPFWRNIS